MTTRSTDGEWRALARRPGYVGFVLTVSASRTAGMMSSVAIVLLVLARTHSPALAGAVVAIGVLPGVLVAPWLGALLDVVSRRRPLIVFDELTSAAAAITLVALAGHAPDWTLLAVGFVSGVSSPLTNGGFQGAIATLAGSELLDRASAIEATSMNGSLVVGPALAGALAGAFGAATVLEVQAVALVVISGVIAADRSFEARSAEPPDTLRTAVRAGSAALRHDRVLRDVTVGGMLTNFGWGIMVVVFPLYAERSLHAHRSAGGYLWSAVAIGSILGTFLLPTAGTRRRIGASYAAIGASGLLWLVAGSLPVGIALVGLSGITDGPGYSGAITLRQRRAPAAARTQVLNTISALTGGAIALGSLLGGAIGDPATAIVVFAVCNLTAAVVLARRGAPPEHDG